MMASGNGSRVYVSQTDIPRVLLEEALRVPKAIADNYALEPTKPLRVAQALDLAPSGGRFQVLTGAAIGYGLTEGGANAELIRLTDLGRRILAPTVEGDDEKARREAVLHPAVIRQFLEKYSGNKLPSKKIAQNVLADEMELPRERTEEAFDIIVDNARAMGFLVDVSGEQYVDLDAAPVGPSDGDPDKPLDHSSDADGNRNGGGSTTPNRLEGMFEPEPEQPSGSPSEARGLKNRRVFISHGKNRKIVEQIKELLEFGDFEPVVSVEKESVAKPVPKKVLDDMRSCSAGIIHPGSCTGWRIGG